MAFTVIKSQPHGRFWAILMRHARYRSPPPPPPSSSKRERGKIYWMNSQDTSGESVPGHTEAVLLAGTRHCVFSFLQFLVERCFDCDQMMISTAQATLEQNRRFLLPMAEIFLIYFIPDPTTLSHPWLKRPSVIFIRNSCSCAGIYLEKKADLKNTNISCVLTSHVACSHLSFLLFIFSSANVVFPESRLARGAVECTAVWHMYTAKRLNFRFCKGLGPAARHRVPSGFWPCTSSCFRHGMVGEGGDARCSLPPSLQIKTRF